MEQEEQHQMELPGFGNTLGIGSHPAVVVVDMIEGFTSPGSPLGSKMDDTVEHIRRLLGAARKKHLPVFFTTVMYHSPDFEDGGWFVKKVPALRILTPGSKWVRIDPRLPYQDGEILEKQYASAFFGTDLNERLQQQDVDTVIVTGCTTSGCVRATVIDAMQHGYRPIVPVEAVADRNTNAHRQNLTDIALKYGDVVPGDDVLQQVMELPET